MMIYIESNSTNPFYNFALEYFLMREKNLPNDKIFMFWRTEPTCMIGRYQNTIAEINERHIKENNIQVVRRITGGGTIYTDLGCWQYSFINRGKAEQIEFKKYLEPIVEALKQIGIKAEFNSRNDLAIDGKKISGNAQCMCNGYTLHHGTLLFESDLEELVKSLRVDDYKIISKGIKSVKERVTNISEHLPIDVDIEEFKSLMVKNIMKSSLGFEKKEYVLTSADIKRINEISKELFETWDWNYGKSPKFNIVKTTRFAGGKVEFKFDVNKGIIEACSIYGDFFGDVDRTKLYDDLVGLKYDSKKIKEILERNQTKYNFYDIDFTQLANDSFS